MTEAILKAKIEEAVMLHIGHDINRSAARDMITGYYVDEKGIATTAPDETGKREYILVNGKPEQKPGEFMEKHPDVLELYDKFDIVLSGTVGSKKRFYFDLKDQNGNFVDRIYKHDSEAMKAVFRALTV